MKLSETNYPDWVKRIAKEECNLQKLDGGDSYKYGLYFCVSEGLNFVRSDSRQGEICRRYVKVKDYERLEKRVKDNDRKHKQLDPTKSVASRPTYERKAERSDGITFERNAIGGRSLKEITESISERKDSIKRDESLLRSHRSLFGKKSCNGK